MVAAEGKESNGGSAGEGTFSNAPVRKARWWQV